MLVTAFAKAVTMAPSSNRFASFESMEEKADLSPQLVQTASEAVVDETDSNRIIIEDLGKYCSVLDGNQALAQYPAIRFILIWLRHKSMIAPWNEPVAALSRSLTISETAIRESIAAVLKKWAYRLHGAIQLLPKAIITMPGWASQFKYLEGRDLWHQVSRTSELIEFPLGEWSTTFVITKMFTAFNRINQSLAGEPEQINGILSVFPLYAAVRMAIGL